MPAFPAFLAFGETKIEQVMLPAGASQPGLRPFVVRETYRKAAEQAIDEAGKARDLAAQKTDRSRRRRPAADRAGAAGRDRRRGRRSRRRRPSSRRSRPERRPIAPRPSNRAHRHSPPSSPRRAAAAKAAEAAAKAEEAASRAELDLLAALPKTKDELAKKFEAAKAALKGTREAAGKSDASYTPLSGSRKTLESNLETEESRSKPFPKTSTGRRSALARWITDPKHPLTARVAVNHVWARHFGRPLVPTVFDFGRKGTPPTHPELLDWLAVELVESGWSMKHIHRLIVSSDAYRLSSSSAGADRKTLAADPENVFYWRANPTRLESELVRDSLLHLAGELDPTIGGPSIPIADETSRRRSLYFVHSNIEHQKFLATFDDASVLECYRRSVSIVPQQALALENSPLANAAAEKIARRWEAAHPPGTSDRDFVRAAFLLVLSVEPSEAEADAALDALSQFAEAGRRAGRSDFAVRARIGLVRALLNHNDFVTHVR